ncbi:MAG TPA: anti-sigma factor [Nocardia sp.]|uniref:ATP-binding protein n=1 Tax=Nocardia TaxID=1817 RepID=UPI002458798F|nr:MULTISPECIES: anti-sigma factor [Nocardia]HLS78622.1 anti-sigma factor [Nocardia sp.]
MGKGEKVFPSAETRTTTVGVRVPARYDQLVMLRALAETVALIADFGIDEVADIRLALDEVATALMQDAVTGTDLDCSMTYDESSMDIAVSAHTVSEDGPDRNGFGWHILTTLTDSVGVDVGARDDTGGYPTIVRFRWSRGRADA